MKKKISFYLSLILLTLVVFISCNRQSIIPASRMGPRLTFYGFTVARPPNTGWFALLSEQKDDVALFRKKLPSTTHTAYVMINLRRMARAATSLEDFVEIDKEKHTVHDTLRFEIVNFTQAPTTRQGQWCVNWTERTIDHNPAQAPNTPLILRSQGFRCIHPIYTSNRVILEAEISERGLEGELDSLTIKEGEEILKSIVLTDTMGVPFK